MIQILKLRKFWSQEENKEIHYDKIISTKEIPSVRYLFEHLDDILNTIPKKEHWNLFYTVANCTGTDKEDKRRFAYSNILAFDIDGIDTDKVEDTAAAVCTAIGVDKDKAGLVASGNGIHVLVELADTINDYHYFKENKLHYKALVKKINTTLKLMGIPGESDPVVFEPRRILRLPGTVNRKPNKDDKPCRLLKTIKEAIHLSLPDLSGIPTTPKEAGLDKKLMDKYPIVDPPAIMDGCGFLKHVRDNPEEISEPIWYAALSITGRMTPPPGDDRGPEHWSHEISKTYSGYSPEETTEKMNQAIEASGPRTCQSISSLWNGCSNCEHYKKITSPILIRGKDTIPTEHTGFHNIDRAGKKKPTPNYEDLAKYYSRHYPYKGLGSSRMVHVWTGTHYRYMEAAEIEQFAQTHFKPFADTRKVTEFRALIQRTNLKPLEWWQETTHKKINLLNGYLDLNTMDFRPHSPDIGFRYVLPYEYDEDAKAPVFSKMLATVTGHNEDTQKVLLEFMGYALSGDNCWAQKALLLYGDGANGKSTFGNVLKQLAGWGNYSVLTMQDLIRHEHCRQMLDGKLFNFVEETSSNTMTDSTMFQQLTNGGEVTGRMQYKVGYTVRNRAKLIFACNDLPPSTQQSYAYYRRFLTVPFQQTFTKDSPGYDPHIDKKLEKELPGILNMALEGYQRLVRQKEFTKSEQSDQLLQDYKLENNATLYWLKEFVAIYNGPEIEEYIIPSRELYQAYRFDMEQMGKKPENEQKFYKDLSRLGKEVWGDTRYEQRKDRKRMETGGPPVRFIKGVRYLEH